MTVGDMTSHESQLRLWKHGMERVIRLVGCATLPPGDGDREETKARRR